MGKLKDTLKGLTGAGSDAPPDVVLPETEQPTADTVTVPVEAPTPEYVLGFDPEKMRKTCGKCGCTQLIFELVWDELKTVVTGKLYTCNDCKQTYKEAIA